MNATLQQELSEFKQYHKNIYNVLFHILCGCVYMGSLFTIAGPYRYSLAIVYGFLVGATLGDVRTAIFSTGLLILTIQLLPSLTLSSLLLLAFVAYMAPELSHYATGEPTLLTVENLTPVTVSINIVYLLPFSLKSLPI